MNARDQIAGYIFLCNSKTILDCFIYRVFGLPASRLADVRKIKPNTKLFLFDFERKLLFGVYVADSTGNLAIEPYAFGGRFHAQVKFSILRDCLPLPEAAFKEAIRENYSGGSKFKQILTEEQVNDLVSLFRRIDIPLPLRPPPLMHDDVEVRNPTDWGSNFQNTDFSSHGQCSSGYDHTNNMLPSTFHNTDFSSHGQCSSGYDHTNNVLPSTFQNTDFSSQPPPQPPGDSAYMHYDSTTTQPPPQPPSDSPYMYDDFTTTQPPRQPPSDSAYMHNDSTTTQPPPQRPGDSAYMYDDSTSTQPPPQPPGDNAYMHYNNTSTQPPPPPAGDSAYMYCNSATAQVVGPSYDYRYQAFEACDQTGTMTYVCETYVTYGATTVPPNFADQVPGAEVSTDPAAGAMPNQFFGPNPTY